MRETWCSVHYKDKMKALPGLYVMREGTTTVETYESRSSAESDFGPEPVMAAFGNKDPVRLSYDYDNVSLLLYQPWPRGRREVTADRIRSKVNDETPTYTTNRAPPDWVCNSATNPDPTSTPAVSGGEFQV